MTTYWPSTCVQKSCSPLLLKARPRNAQASLLCQALQPTGIPWWARIGIGNHAVLETVIVLEVEQLEAPNFVTVVEAGMLAKTGFNSAGIGLATNALVTDQDRGDPGVPYHVILRAILDAETMAQALLAITSHSRASSANYLLAHSTGETIDVEAAPGDYGHVFMDFEPQDHLTHTNHFLRPIGGLKDAGMWEGTSSPLRYMRMRRLLRQYAGRVSPDILQRILADHFDEPGSICRHTSPQLPEMEQIVTVASVIMDLNTRTMWLADGNPCHCPYRELDYHSLLYRAPTSERMTPPRTEQKVPKKTESQVLWKWSND